ncbi:hypothetical protein CPC08DRAFT_714176, partial [Agrocybe pediades]
MNQALEIPRDELKEALDKILPAIEERHSSRKYLSLFEELWHLRKVLDSGFEDFPVLFRAWDRGFEKWARNRVSFLDSLREGPVSQDWVAFIDKKEALKAAIQR